MAHAASLETGSPTAQPVFVFVEPTPLHGKNVHADPDSSSNVTAVN
jgi:hypothetical protein